MEDASIHGHGRWLHSAELVSPVLRGVEGLQTIIDVLRAIAPLRPCVNDTTGLHVHVSKPGTQQPCCMPDAFLAASSGSRPEACCMAGLRTDCHHALLALACM